MKQTNQTLFTQTKPERRLTSKPSGLAQRALDRPGSKAAATLPEEWVLNGVSA
jgi:hypothetical protein